MRDTEVNVETDPGLIPIQEGSGGPFLPPIVVPVAGAVTSIDGMVGPGITFNTAAPLNGVAVSKVSAANATTFGITGVGTMAQRNAVAANADAVSADATDLATALTLLNELKAQFNSLQAKMRTANHLTP